MNKFEGENEPSFYRNKEHQEAGERFERLVPLGVTAEDFRAVGGTPPKELLENSGKTRADLMNDKEIAEWLDKKRNELKDLLKDKTGNDIIKRQIKSNRQYIKNTIRHLREIGQLPKDYEDYDVDREFKPQ